MKEAFLLFTSFLILQILPAQCPDKDFLFHRIIYLRDSSSVTNSDQLNELVNYESKIGNCSYQNDSVHALLLQRIGWLYTTSNDFYNAVKFTKKSIALINEHNTSANINAALAVKCYWNLCLIYDSLKLESKKIEAADSCISMSMKLRKNYEYAIGAIKFMTPVLFNNGDYYKCITYSNLGESLVKNIPAQDEDALFTFFVWKINSLLILNKTSDALGLLDPVKKNAEKENSRYLGTLYALYATALQKQGEINDAIIYFRKAFIYNKKVAFNEGCAEALNNIGYAYFKFFNQGKTAITYYREALLFSSDDEALNIFDNIANVYTAENNFDSAFYFFKKASSLIHPGFSESDLLKKNVLFADDRMTEYITGMLLDKAAAFLKNYTIEHNKNLLANAITIYESIDNYFDKLKLSQTDVESKLFWKANNKRLYEQAVEACYISGNIEKAVYFFEKNRSVLLNSEVAQQRKMNDLDLAKQAQLKANILGFEKKLQATAPSSNEYVANQQQLFIAQHEAEDFVSKINIQSSTVIKPGEAFITLKQLRKKILVNSNSLLEIFYGDSAVYVLTITGNNESLIKLNKEQYDRLTNSFISFIGNRYELNNHFRDFVKISHQLYALLFQNVSLAGNSIIISPDGKNFPFEALIKNEDDQNPDYFLSHYATSYTYSANYLTNEFVSNTSNNILGFAPVNYQNFAQLSGSDASLKKINNYFSNATNFIFEKATKNNFFQNFADYSIIQLYTHAADTSNKNGPVIYFADSALYLSNLIPDKKPVTQLVVLSACETANGKFNEGEGIFSFNRGFAALGIPAAVSNLWSVDNESTYTITELFYKYLSQGLPTDVALQKAKLEFINNNSSSDKRLPYFWAASVLTGKVEIIKAEKQFTWITWSIISIISFAILFLILKIFLQRKIKANGKGYTKI